MPDMSNMEPHLHTTHKVNKVKITLKFLWCINYYPLKQGLISVGFVALLSMNTYILLQYFCFNETFFHSSCRSKRKQ